jgi:microcystin-dependent protein
MTGWTPNKGLPYPDDYAAVADVPKDMQALAEATDAALVAQDQNVANAAPIGTVVMYAAATAPDGWHLCNGTAHGSAELQAILGSPNTPDLRGLFITGAGGSYAVGATGGANSVTLTGAQSGEKGHNHTSVSGGNHQHNSPPGYSFMLTDPDGNVSAQNNSGGVSKPTGWVANTMAAGSHSHTIHSVGASSATQSHENRPPYYALTYIIRKG